ncbi:hypothetical protein COLO4_29232 [Corchorus olitorius]|uniref:Uncharacterized protein n=1 Tax=Corchorus olitorius TaxID=93759 RepID=A0A1R3HFH8_9ROSI|nr:hypothetical protein COLO4_29232 [Corchorus olitorius]
MDSWIPNLQAFKICTKFQIQQQAMEGKAMKGLMQTMLLFLLMVALAMGHQPGLIIRAPPPRFSTIIPPRMPPRDDLFPPTMPGVGLIPPLTPGTGLDPSKGKSCATHCSVKCQKIRSNSLASRLCVSSCMLGCGNRISSDVYSCSKKCSISKSMSPDPISDSRGGEQSHVTACYKLCRKN